jgi:hypothetical protein
LCIFVPVAQLDRALASGARGCAFESHRGYLVSLSETNIRRNLEYKPKGLQENETGLRVVLKAGRKPEVLKTNKPDEKFRSSVAVMGENLFLRGLDCLYFIAGLVVFGRPTLQPDRRDSYLFRLRFNKDCNTIDDRTGVYESVS